MAGCARVGESFLRDDKWQKELLGDFFSINIEPFMNDSLKK